MEPAPLGEFTRRLPPALGAATVLLASAAAAALFALSRWLAERDRGRWYAGNERDLFHAAGTLVLASGLWSQGHAAPLAFVWASLASAVPLVWLDSLPGSPRARFLTLWGMVGAALLPTLGAPREVAAALNELAAFLFDRGG